MLEIIRVQKIKNNDSRGGTSKDKQRDNDQIQTTQGQNK